MKKLIMLAVLVIIVAAVGVAYAAHDRRMIVQAESSPAAQPVPDPAIPTPKPEPASAMVPTSTAPVSAESATVPVVPVLQPEPASAMVPTAAAPVSAASPTAPVAKPEGLMVHQMSHKDFATMTLKECADCHKGSGVAPTHGSDQMREHSFLARRAGKNCTDCHNQQFCLDCHKGGGISADLSISNYLTNYTPKTHRTDFLEIHPLKAPDNPQTCYRCHDAKYCSACHAKFRGEDLKIQSHRTEWSDSRPSALSGLHSSFSPDSCRTCHPGGLLSTHVWSADHALEARRNLQSCQTCHSDGEVCMKCHSARRGLMVNPHPRDWNSVKNRYSRRSGGRSCVKCHDNY